MHSECSLPFPVVHLNTLDAALSSGCIILSLACFGSFRTILKKQNTREHLSQVKVKVKIHSRTGHEGPEVEQRYSSTLSLTSALHVVGGQHHAPAALSPEIPRYYLYMNWDEPQGRFGGERKISPTTGIRSPDRPARSESYRLSCPGRYMSEVS